MSVADVAKVRDAVRPRAGPPVEPTAPPQRSFAVMVTRDGDPEALIGPMQRDAATKLMERVNGANNSYRAETWMMTDPNIYALTET